MVSLLLTSREISRTTKYLNKIQNNSKTPKTVNMIELFILFRLNYSHLRSKCRIKNSIMLTVFVVTLVLFSNIYIL